MAHVLVVGGGVVGLSTAWFLRERGEEVTVVDAGRAGMGASYGNAGWLTPGISTPLPDPAILAYGLRAVASPDSPVYMPISFDPELWGFLLRFLRNSTSSRWMRAMRSLIGINVHAFDAFDTLARGGSDGLGRVEVPTHVPGQGGATAFIAAYTDVRHRKGLQHEFDQIDAAGQPVSYDLLDGDEVRAAVPGLSDAITAGLRLHDTRFIDPPRYVASLREAVLARGVRIVEDTEVLKIADDGARVRLVLRRATGGVRADAHPPRHEASGVRVDEDAPATGETVGTATGASSLAAADMPSSSAASAREVGGMPSSGEAPSSGASARAVGSTPPSSGGTPSSGSPDVLEGDSAVVAPRALLGRRAREFGARTPARAGRGYSFSVPADPMPTGPVYFPFERVACTPLSDRFRVAGMMEFRKSVAPFDPRRVAAIVRATRPLFQDLPSEGTGIDLSDREDEWVGSRPCTADGLPLIGRTRSPRVFVAGGHGMWGITLGPVTGQLLAELITTGTAPAALEPFSPLR